MKLKRVMRALSLILVMALLTAMFVPVVSAKEQEQTQNENISERLVVTPVFDEQEISIKVPMDESEIISFIFTEKWLIENDKSQNSDFIKITIPKTEIYNEQYDLNGVSNLKAIGKIEDNEKVVLLQVPKNIPELDKLIYRRTITLDYPTYCYSYFSDISKLFNEINKRKSTRDQGQKEQIKSVTNQKQIFQSKSSNLYAEWACYNTNWFQYPKALRGDMNPENLLNLPFR